MAEKLYYTMGEVAEMFDVNPSLLRHWETQFPELKPKRNKKGNRLFSAKDVENLKLIYHLVKERGMTLDGARKALRQHRRDDGIARDAALMERLQRIRALLAEVREELKDPDGLPAEPLAEGESEPAADPAAVLAAEPAAESQPEPMPAPVPEPPAQEPPARKPRRRKSDDDSQELFAFYEQSLF